MTKIKKNVFHFNKNYFLSIFLIQLYGKIQDCFSGFVCRMSTFYIKEYKKSSKAVTEYCLLWFIESNGNKYLFTQDITVKIKTK